MTEVEKIIEGLPNIVDFTTQMLSVAKSDGLDILYKFLQNEDNFYKDEKYEKSVGEGLDEKKYLLMAQFGNLIVTHGYGQDPAGAINFAVKKTAKIMEILLAAELVEKFYLKPIYMDGILADTATGVFVDKNLTEIPSMMNANGYLLPTGYIADGDFVVQKRVFMLCLIPSLKAVWNETNSIVNHPTVVMQNLNIMLKQLYYPLSHGFEFLEQGVFNPKEIFVTS